VHAVPRALDEASYLILAEYARQNARLLGEWQIIEREIASFQRPLIEKPQGRHDVLDTAWRQLLLV
jgi:hypothetical protein